MNHDKIFKKPYIMADPSFGCLSINMFLRHLSFTILDCLITFSLLKSPNIWYMLQLILSKYVYTLVLKTLMLYRKIELFSSCITFLNTYSCAQNCTMFFKGQAHPLNCTTPQVKIQPLTPYLLFLRMGTREFCSQTINFQINASQTPAPTQVLVYPKQNGGKREQL